MSGPPVPQPPLPILVLLHVSYCLTITCRLVIVYRGHRQNAGATYDGLYGGEHELGINKVCVAELLSPLAFPRSCSSRLVYKQSVTDFPREWHRQHSHLMSSYSMADMVQGICNAF